MKRIISLAVFCLSLVQLIAQNLPQGIAYQAVAVKDGPYSLAGQNPQAIYWSNKDIKVRFTIYEKYPAGSTQYSESHATKTDDYGVFNLIIGQGNPISGDFTKIPWDLGTAHLQVEIDFDNNGTYKLTSLERFWSVPYAFVTRKSSSTSTDSALNALNSKFNYLKNRDKDTVTGNEWQKLTRNKDTLILSDGGGKITLLDEDSKNELQLLTRNKDTVSLSQNGGEFVLNDDDPKNELQGLFIQNDSLKISKNNGGISLKKLTTPSNRINTIDSAINVISTQNSWMWGGGWSGPTLTSQKVITRPNPYNCAIVHGDTVNFGDFSNSIKDGSPINWKFKLQGGYGNIPIFINQDSIIITGGWSATQKSLSSGYPRTVNITSYPGNKIIFNMDATYPNHALTSFFEDMDCSGGMCIPAYYYKDTLSVIRGNRLVVLLPKQNIKLLDKTIDIRTQVNGSCTVNIVTGSFQIDNKYYFIEGDTLKRIDNNGKIYFELDLNYIGLGISSSIYFVDRPMSHNFNKKCIVIDKDIVFIVNDYARGLFVNLSTKKVTTFLPQSTLFDQGLYFYNGKSIFHTYMGYLSGGNAKDRFYTEKINIR